ncbi:hypothetical protein EPN52_02950 [bacterium]|nr:MAG: hypothetical protein EPN52_02950 [bacterium]
MRGGWLQIAGAGGSFVAAVVVGLYLGWLAGSRSGHPALVVAGLFLGMVAGGVLVGSMIARMRF